MNEQHRGMSQMRLIDAVMRHELTPEQAADEMSRRDIRRRGPWHITCGIVILTLLVVSMIGIAAKRDWMMTLFCAGVTVSMAVDVVGEIRDYRKAE